MKRPINVSMNQKLEEKTMPMRVKIKPAMITDMKIICNLLSLVVKGLGNRAVGACCTKGSGGGEGGYCGCGVGG